MKHTWTTASGSCFLFQINKIDKQFVEDIFNFNGPLGTFSSRINLAYALHFMSERSFRQLTQFRKIRNEFAHSPFGINFSTQRIKDRIEKIEVHHIEFLREIRKTESIKKLTKDPSKLTMKELFLIKASLSLSKMVSEMLMFPISSRNNIPAEAVLSDYDNLPENLKSIRTNAAECVLEIFLKRK